jgi:hypothetical protein
MSRHTRKEKLDKGANQQLGIKGILGAPTEISATASDQSGGDFLKSVR